MPLQQPKQQRICGNNSQIQASPSQMMCSYIIMLLCMSIIKQLHSLKTVKKSVNLLFQCHHCVRDEDLRGNDTPPLNHREQITDILQHIYLHFSVNLCIFLHNTWLSSHSDEIHHSITPNFLFRPQYLSLNSRWRSLQWEAVGSGCRWLIVSHSFWILYREADS